MNIVAQEARKRQAVVKLSVRKGKSFASRIYGVSLSSVKRWCKRYDGDWRSLAEGSHRPHSHPKRHTADEEGLIKKAFKEQYLRYGWEGMYHAAVKAGYTRSFSGMVYAARRMGLGSELKEKKKAAYKPKPVSRIDLSGRKGANRRQGSAVCVLKRRPAP